MLVLPVFDLYSCPRRTEVPHRVAVKGMFATEHYCWPGLSEQCCAMLRVLVQPVQASVAMGRAIYIYLILFRDVVLMNYNIRLDCLHIARSEIPPAYSYAEQLLFMRLYLPISSTNHYSMVQNVVLLPGSRIVWACPVVQIDA